MKVDASEVDRQASCYSPVDAKTLRTWTFDVQENSDGYPEAQGGGYTQDYILIGNKYKMVHSTDLPTPFVWDNNPYKNAYPQGVSCYTIEDVENFDSPYDFITPIYHVMAIASVLFIFYMSYKLLIYPWFRKRLK